MLVCGAVRCREADLRQSILEAYGFGGASVALVGFQIPRSALGDLGDDEPARDVGDPVAISASDYEELGEGERKCARKEHAVGVLVQLVWLRRREAIRTIRLCHFLFVKSPLKSRYLLDTASALAPPKFRPRSLYYTPLLPHVIHHITPYHPHPTRIPPASLLPPAMVSNDTTPSSPEVQNSDIHVRNGVLQHPIPPACKGSLVLCGVEMVRETQPPSKFTDLRVSLSMIPIASVGAMGVAEWVGGPGGFSADCAIVVVDSGMGDLRDYVIGCWRGCR